MPKFIIYKQCRVCEGRKEVDVTFTDGTVRTLMCASCQGRGNFVWGWMEEEVTTGKTWKSEQERCREE